jgi:NADH:ubiquinone oxidoreductase subunit 3 (subunit A)
MEDKKIPPVSNFYTAIRAQVEHLNNNLSQRIIWLVIAQSFFFNGYALLILGKPQLPALQKIFSLLLVVVPLASLFTVIVTFLDVLGTKRRRKKLRLRYESRAEPTEMECYPEIDGTASQRILEHVAPITLPIMFILVWLILLAYSLHS